MDTNSLVAAERLREPADIQCIGHDYSGPYRCQWFCLDASRTERICGAV